MIHSYIGLSETEFLEIFWERDRRIAELEDTQFRHLRTLAEYKEIIWGKKSEAHIRVLAQQDLDTAQPEIPFPDLPSMKTTIIPITGKGQAYTTRSKPTYQRSVKPAGRKKLSPTLPREYVEILPEGYHEGMVRIDSEETEELDYRQGSFFVRVISRPRFVNPQTKSVVIAPMPARPIHKGIAGAGLLAYILVSRFCDHLPYYRQVKMLNRYGEQIVNTSTMGRWVKESINLLSIIHSRIRDRVLLNSYLQADETTIKVLDRHKECGKHLGFLWGYHAPLEKLVLIEYGQGRAAEYPEAFLGDFCGVFQTDAYSGYEKLLKNKDQLTHVCCWAHGRRNFFKALGSDKQLASQALDLIGELYAVEALARSRNATVSERLALRTEFSVPALKNIHDWAQAQMVKLNPKSQISQACYYLLRRWDKFTYYASDGRIEIDNNLLENLFRPTALGRKNWLFAGNHDAAERSGIIYSIVACCTLNNIEPFAYLNDVLTRLPDLMFAPKEKIDELLPGNWKPQAEKRYQAAVRINWSKTG